MPESIVETTEIIDSTPKRTTKAKTPVLTGAETATIPNTVWVLQNKYQGTITNKGVYGSEDNLLEAFSTLTKVDEVYQDCDQNGNGFIAFEMPIL